MFAKMAPTIKIVQALPRAGVGVAKESEKTSLFTRTEKSQCKQQRGRSRGDLARLTRGIRKEAVQKNKLAAYMSRGLCSTSRRRERVGKWKKNIELDLVRLEIVFAVSRSQFVVASLQVLGSGCWVLVSGRHRNVFGP